MDRFDNFQSYYDVGPNHRRGVLIPSITTPCEMGYTQRAFHWHSHCEILMIRQGNYHIESCGRIITGTKPRAFVHFPYSLHYGKAEQNCMYARYIIIFDKQLLHLFSPKLLDSDSFYQANFIYTDPTPEEMAELFGYAEKLIKYQHNSTMSKLFTAIILQKIIMICDAGRGEILRGKHSYIQEVLQYMIDNLKQPPHAIDIAAKFGVSKTKFHADFKATVGKTYKQHLTDLRQTFARELLDSGTSIINAAIDTGYSSEAHFIKAFREYWGITPGEYIKNEKEQR